MNDVHLGTYINLEIERNNQINKITKKNNNNDGKEILINIQTEKTLNEPISMSITIWKDLKGKENNNFLSRPTNIRAENASQKIWWCLKTDNFVPPKFIPTITDNLSSIFFW